MSSYPLLVEPDWLKAHLSEPALRVLDCTTYMVTQPVGASKILSGWTDFESGHIPGSSHLDMADDLSEPEGPYPFTMLSSVRFETLMQRLGIQRDDHVVLYGRSAMTTITRAWAVFHVNGHERVSILNGGWRGWLEANGAVSDALPIIVPSQYEAQVRQTHRLVSMAEVALAREHTANPLLNALSREQFRGTGGAHYGRVGRIPGSVNVPARELFDADSNRFIELEAIERHFQAAGLNWQAPIIHYCGGGIAASTSAFAQTLLGGTNWALYDNSLLEWSVQPDTPMETG